MNLNTYLHFPDNCKQAMEFYARVFNGKIEAMSTFGESPMCDQMPAEMRGTIMHSALKIGDQYLFASDSPPEYRTPIQGFHISINTATPAETERLFNALADGGTVQMPLDETFWAIKFGMLVDRFGTPWMLNCAREQ